MTNKASPKKAQKDSSNSTDDDWESDGENDKEMNDIVEDVEADKMEEEKNKTKWQKVKSSVVEWGEASSCHGIPHMAQATTLCAAIVWGVILFFAAVGFVYLFSNTLAQYLRFEKIVQLNLGLDSNNFPSVTFCNINPYKLSKIKAVPELAALLFVYESSANGTLST